MKNQKTTILIIEDEKNICEFMSTSLTGHGYKIITAQTAKEGISLVTSQCPDLILLDLGLPDKDGICVIEQVRNWSLIPIIVISARTQEKDKVLALDLGADDYITKPFGIEELLARIRTALRHSNMAGSSSQAKIFKAKGLKINFDKRIVTINDEPVHFTQIEFKIIALLAKHSGKVLTYDFIMKQIWGPYMEEDNRILRVNMANIRRKIGNNPAEPQYIFTEVGIGYRMIEEDDITNGS
ncbi:MAG: response regulator transcription factor [Lachnospiraceae bacterium]|nr:response regulator transcription factor [Lachnospiraceae bacterium]MEE1341910.1 response regulator transcription factor [Lachnospiraceae bacterium]